MAQAAPNAETIEINPAATQAAIEANKPKMIAVRLLRNYNPEGEYEVVGYDRPEIKVKDAGGKPVVIQEAAYIKGEEAPPPTPGVGSGRRVWAGTTIRIPVEEARTVRKNGIGEIEIDLD